MRMTANKVELFGNVGRDPEFSVLENTNITIAKFSLATNEDWTNRETNEKQSHTEWHNIVVKDQRMINDFVKENIRKGVKLFVVGRIRTRSWKNDRDENRYITEILASAIFADNSVRMNVEKEEDSIPY